MMLVQNVEKNNLGEVFFAPTDVFLDKENVFQPDLLFIARGREEFLSERGYIDGAPDLVVEILYILRESGYTLIQKAGKGEKFRSEVVKDFVLKIDDIF